VTPNQRDTRRSSLGPARSYQRPWATITFSGSQASTGSKEARASSLRPRKVSRRSTGAFSSHNVKSGCTNGRGVRADILEREAWEAVSPSY
jgi:hypothetical protein